MDEYMLVGGLWQETLPARAGVGADNGGVNSVDSDGPGNPEPRGRTRESERQLRAILMRWDPIGIAEEPKAADEYDCMIGPLLHQLHDGVAQRQLNGWLVAELEDHFGLDADAGREAALVAELVQWWRLRSVDPSP